MKFNNIVLLFVAILLISCSESDTSTNPDAETDYTAELNKLFPYNNDLTYEFLVDTLNKSNSSFHKKGKRVVSYLGEVTVGDYEYYSSQQFHDFISSDLSLKMKYRTTENSINLLADTSRVWEVIPDSLSMIISITVEDEIILLQLPFESESRWPVVKAYVDFQTFQFNTVDVEAIYLGNESLKIPMLETPVNADVVEYKLDINSPDIENPFISNTETFFAKLWFAEDYGIVKMEGCSFMLNIIAGYPMNFGHLGLTSKQVLSKIK